MYLIQIFLPVTPSQGITHLHEVRETLASRFGGVTAYAQSPAKGLWKDRSQRIVEDEVVVMEVMVEEIDRPWWKDYQQKLEALLGQDEILVRTMQIERL